MKREVCASMEKMFETKNKVKQREDDSSFFIRKESCFSLLNSCCPQVRKEMVDHTVALSIKSEEESKYHMKWDIPQ